MKPFLFIFCAALVAPFAVAADPSFQCSGTLTPTEQTICDYQDLGFLDRELAGLFAALPTEGAGAWRRAEQRDWVARRNECHTDDECIAAAYWDRISALAPQPGGQTVSGEYALVQPGNQGALRLVPRVDGDLSVYATIVQGPSYHICTYRGLLQRQDNVLDLSDTLRAMRWQGSSTEINDRLCTVSVLVSGDMASILSDGCQAYCGARARLNGTFTLVD